MWINIRKKAYYIFTLGSDPDDVIRNAFKAFDKDGLISSEV